MRARVWDLFTQVSVGLVLGYLLYALWVLTLGYTGISLFGHEARKRVCAEVYVEGRGDVWMCEEGGGCGR